MDLIFSSVARCAMRRVASAWSSMGPIAPAPTAGRRRDAGMVPDCDRVWSHAGLVFPSMWVWVDPQPRLSSRSAICCALKASNPVTPFSLAVPIPYAGHVQQNSNTLGDTSLRMTGRQTLSWLSIDFIGHESHWPSSHHQWPHLDPSRNIKITPQQYRINLNISLFPQQQACSPFRIVKATTPRKSSADWFGPLMKNKFQYSASMQ